MSTKKAAEETAVEKKTSARKAAAEKAVKTASVKAAEATTKVEKAVKSAVKATETAVEKAAEKKPATRKTAAKKTAEVIIQSPLGGEITGAEILARVGNVDKVYVRVDENKAYWVSGDEAGSVDLW